MAKNVGKHQAINNKKNTRKTKSTKNFENINRKEVRSKNQKSSQVKNNNKVKLNSNSNKRIQKEYTEYNEKNKEKKKGKRKIGRKILSILFIAFIIFFAVRMTDNGWTYGGFLATCLGHTSKTVDTLEPIYIIVTGESQGLTDTIMLCEYNPKENTANIISIPRDTFIGNNKNRASANDKINTLYSRSPEKLVQKINDITGLNIKYYMNIDTKGLRALIDEMGGVYFDVPIDMDYDDDTQDLHIHLKAGYQLLDGDKAEQVVRFRHNNDGSSYPAEYGDNDIGRMRTQREFITTIAKQLVNKKSITKINKYKELFQKYVKTNYDLNSLIHYAPYMLDFKMENLNTTTLPGEPKLCNGVWLYIPNEEKIQELINEKLN